MNNKEGEPVIMLVPLCLFNRMISFPIGVATISVQSWPQWVVRELIPASHVSRASFVHSFFYSPIFVEQRTTCWSTDICNNVDVCSICYISLSIRG